MDRNTIRNNNIKMRKYLICYYVERNDVCTDLEKIIEAADIRHALYEFETTHRFKRITSISELINVNFIP